MDLKFSLFQVSELSKIFQAKELLTISWHYAVYDDFDHLLFIFFFIVLSTNFQIAFQEYFCNPPSLTLNPTKWHRFTSSLTVAHIYSILLYFMIKQISVLLT